MAVDTKQYLEELFKAAGVSDDTVKQAVSGFFLNDAVAKRVGDDILRQQDYSRNMDELRKKEKQTADYYQSLVTWKTEQDAALAAAAAGNTNGNGNVNIDYVSKKELDELRKNYDTQAKQQEANFITIAKEMGRLSSQHAVEFKEPLDVDALEKIAVEKQLPLRQAYDQLVGDRRRQSQEAAFAQKLADAKAEGAREFASTHKIPVDTQPREYHPIFDRDPKKQVGADDYVPNSGRLSNTAESNLRSNFVDAWNSASGNTSGT